MADALLLSGGITLLIWSGYLFGYATKFMDKDDRPVS